MSNLLVVDKDVLELIFLKVSRKEYKLNTEEIIGKSIKFNNNKYLNQVLGISKDTVFKVVSSNSKNPELTLQIIDNSTNNKILLPRLIKNLNYYLNSFRIKLSPIYGFKQISISNESNIRKK